MTQLTAFLRRHLGTLVGAVAGTIVVVGGVLVLTVAGSGHTSSASPTTTASPGRATTTTVPVPAPLGSDAASSTTAPAGAAGGSASASGARSGTGARAASGARGTVTALADGRWTITTPRGVTVTVLVSAATQLGTLAAPLTSADFAVGDTVAVIGSRSGATVTATRILRAAAAPAAPPAT